MGIRQGLAAALLVGLAADCHAQLIVPPANAVGFTYSGRRLKVSGYASSGFGVIYPGVGYGSLAPVVPLGIVENRVTVQIIAPTVVVVPRGFAPASTYDLTGVDLDAGPAPWLEKRELARGPKKPPEPLAGPPKKNPPPLEEPEIVVKPAKPFKVVPDLPPPRDDPLEENLRLTGLGLGSFRVSDFGWAAKWWSQAIDIAPAKPRPYFLLAQAYYAMGKYKQAVAAIEGGLRLQPEWPTLPFAIKKEMYVGQDEEWVQQRRWLEETRAQNPREPAFTFLLAYQLWYDGDRQEAAKLLRQARMLSPDPTYIDLFLKALPPPVVALQ